MIRTIRDFQLLSGDSVREYYMNYRLYSDRISVMAQRAVIAISLETLNHQEAILKVKMLQRFEEQSELLEVFKKGNKILNRIIVKDPKFIRYVAQEMNVDNFVDAICPTLSYVSKLLLFNKLSAVMENGDELFNKIREKYGIRLAYRLLPTCSEKLVMEIMHNYNLRLTGRQLIVLHRKYPNFLENYFEAGYANFLGFKRLISYLVKNDMYTLRKLLRFGIPTLGRKGVLKLLALDKEFVLKNSTKFQNHCGSIVRKLSSSDFDIYYLNLFPESIDGSPNFRDAIRNLAFIPRHIRLKRFSKIHLDLYGQDFTDIKKDLMELLPWKDRNTFDLRKNSEFLQTDTAVQMLEEQMKSHYDAETKCRLITKIIKACRMNKEAKFLVHFLHKFCIHHIRADETVRNTLLEQIMCNFNYNTLCEKSWFYIKLIFTTLKVKRELNLDEKDVAKALIMRKMLMEDDFNDDKIRFLNATIGCNYYNALGRHEPNHHRDFLLKFANIVEDSIESLKPEILVYIVHLLYTFNKLNPKFKISYYKFPNILQNVFDMFVNGNNTRLLARIDTVLRFIPSDAVECELHNRLLHTILMSSRSKISYPLGIWILKNRPDIYIRFTRKFLSNPYKRIYYEISKMHYTTLPRIFRRECLFQLRNRYNTNVLWYLSHERDYLDLMRNIIPCNNMTINLNDPDMENNVAFRTIIFKSFKNRVTEKPHIRILLHYLRGDYFNFAISPLYRSYYHLPEVDLVQYLTESNDISDSAKIHSIHLSTKLLQYDCFRPLLDQTTSADKIRRVLLVSTFYGFCNNPKPGLLHCLKDSMNILKNHPLIFKFELVPKDVLSYYIRGLYHYFQGASPSDLRSFDILTPALISTLSPDIIMNIINLGLFFHGCFQFLYNYIISSHRDPVTILCEAIKNLEFASKPSLMLKFIDFICRRFVRDKNGVLAESKCRQLWTYSVQGSFNTIEIGMRLNTVSCYFQLGLNGLANFFIDHQHDILKQHGRCIIKYHSKIVNDCLRMIMENSDGNVAMNTCNFINTVLTKARSTHHRLLAMEMFPSTDNKNLEFVSYFLVLLSRVTEDPSEVLQKLLYFKLARPLFK